MDYTRTRWFCFMIGLHSWMKLSSCANCTVDLDTPAYLQQDKTSTFTAEEGKKHTVPFNVTANHCSLIHPLVVDVFTQLNTQSQQPQCAYSEGNSKPSAQTSCSIHCAKRDVGSQWSCRLEATFPRDLNLWTLKAQVGFVSKQVQFRVNVTAATESGSEMTLTWAPLNDLTLAVTIAAIGAALTFGIVIGVLISKGRERCRGQSDDGQPQHAQEPSYIDMQGGRLSFDSPDRKSCKDQPDDDGQPQQPQEPSYIDMQGGRLSFDSKDMTSPDYIRQSQASVDEKDDVMTVGYVSMKRHGGVVMRAAPGHGAEEAAYYNTGNQRATAPVPAYVNQHDLAINAYNQRSQSQYM